MWHDVGDVIDSSDLCCVEVNGELFDFIAEGYAEEVTDIDIEEIRKNKSVKLREAWNVGYDGAVHTVTTLKCLQQKEIKWFSAYRVVSGVIRQLNGDWVADWSDDTQFKRCLVYNHCDRSFKEKGFGGYNASTTQGCILPPCKDSETAQKLIDLCTPELETLFNIK